MEEDIDPFYQGMNAYDQGCKEWDNPFMPGTDSYREWLGGFFYAQEEMDFPTLGEHLYLGGEG